MSDPLFFHKDTKKKCNHSTLNVCKKNNCWYRENLTDCCLTALHNQKNHSNCKGEYLVGYTGDKGAAIYNDCACLCHKDKYFSPFTGYWE